MYVWWYNFACSYFYLPISSWSLFLLIHIALNSRVSELNDFFEKKCLIYRFFLFFLKKSPDFRKSSKHNTGVKLRSDTEVLDLPSSWKSNKYSFTFMTYIMKAVECSFQLLNLQVMQPFGNSWLRKNFVFLNAITKFVPGYSRTKSEMMPINLKINGTRYSRMNQVKLMEHSLKKFWSDMVCLGTLLLLNFST